MLSYLYVLAGVICVLSLALLFATFTNSSLTAAIAALVVVIVMNILGAFSYFDFLKPYLFTSHIDAWQGLLSQPIDWHPILKGVLVFAIYTGPDGWPPGTSSGARTSWSRRCGPASKEDP